MCSFCWANDDDALCDVLYYIKIYMIWVFIAGELLEFLKINYHIITKLV